MELTIHIYITKSLIEYSTKRQRVQSEKDETESWLFPPKLHLGAEESRMKMKLIRLKTQMIQRLQSTNA